jgi:hypothetical protein
MHVAMTHYPIIFTLRDPVVGQGFLAGVEVNGRALMREEEEGFWIDGVNPGAVCAGGASRDEALLRFRESYRTVLYDIASSAGSFEDFRAEVERFFWEETPGEAQAWQRAVEELRTDPGKAGDWLPVATTYPEPRVSVVRFEKEQLEPRDNPAERMELAAAAA